MTIFKNSSGRNFLALLVLARISPRAPVDERAPKRKTPYILEPQNAPKTIRRNSDYPQDFYLYQFDGPMIEQVRCTGADGEEIRCPALVARMIRKTEYMQGAMMGAKSLEEMTCSVKDLRTYRDIEKGIMGHPDTDKITLELATYYQRKVASKQRDKGTPIPETDFAHMGSNSFFYAMNPRISASIAEPAKSCAS